eukprot:1236434-Pleurochrysis_carterae.AAC.2
MVFCAVLAGLLGGQIAHDGGAALRDARHRGLPGRRDGRAPLPVRAGAPLRAMEAGAGRHGGGTARPHARKSQLATSCGLRASPSALQHAFCCVCGCHAAP